MKHTEQGWFAEPQDRKRPLCCLCTFHSAASVWIGIPGLASKNVAFANTLLIG